MTPRLGEIVMLSSRHYCLSTSKGRGHLEMNTLLMELDIACYEDIRVAKGDKVYI